MKLLVQYAMSHCGLPYKWGGDDPIKGYDCSGLVQEILASVGADPVGDQTAHSLYLNLKRRGYRGLRQAGSICFYGSQEKIVHCGFAIDPFRMVEAGGGSSRTRDREDSADQNAYVRVRPILSRGDFLEAILPRYAELSS